MPYTVEELDNLEFYQDIIRRDESEYLEIIEKRTTSGNTNDGILRESSGKIVLFENIVPGQGTDGTSHVGNHTISYSHGYFEYEENEDLSKVIDREFTEL